MFLEVLGPSTEAGNEQANVTGGKEGQRGHEQVLAPLQCPCVHRSVTAAGTGSDRGGQGRKAEAGWERPQGGRERGFRDPQSPSLYKEHPLLLLPPLPRSGEGRQPPKPRNRSSLPAKVIEDTKQRQKALCGACAGGLTQGQRRGSGDFPAGLCSRVLPTRMAVPDAPGAAPAATAPEPGTAGGVTHTELPFDPTFSLEQGSFSRGHRHLCS